MNQIIKYFKYKKCQKSHLKRKGVTFSYIRNKKRIPQKNLPQFLNLFLSSYNITYQRHKKQTQKSVTHRGTLPLIDDQNPDHSIIWATREIKFEKMSVWIAAVPKRCQHRSMPETNIASSNAGPASPIFNSSASPSFSP